MGRPAASADVQPFGRSLFDPRLKMFVFQTLFDGKTEQELPGTGVRGVSEDRAREETFTVGGVGAAPPGIAPSATNRPVQIATACLRGHHRPSRSTTGTGGNPSTHTMALSIHGGGQRSIG